MQYIVLVTVDGVKRSPMICEDYIEELYDLMVDDFGEVDYRVWDVQIDVWVVLGESTQNVWVRTGICPAVDYYMHSNGFVQREGCWVPPHLKGWGVEVDEEYDIPF